MYYNHVVLMPGVKQDNYNDIVTIINGMIIT